MKRQDELNDAWCKYMGKFSTEIMQALAFALRWADEHPVVKVGSELKNYERGYEDAIDKACKWLDYHLTFNVAEWDEGYTTQRVIDKFRKAMKGE